MLFDEIKYQEFSVSEFNETYLNTHSEALHANTINIFNSEPTVYPPRNEMPDNPVYYDLPPIIKKFKNLQALTLSGVFVSNLPFEIESLSNLRHIGISLGTKSDIINICKILQHTPKLESLSLTGSVISDQSLNHIKSSLPKVRVIALLREMNIQ